MYSCRIRGRQSPAYRQCQWLEQVGTAYYLLDFAVFCVRGRLDIETDSDTYHTHPERVPLDNRRDNDLRSIGWRVMRFNGQQIREEMASYGIPQVVEAIGRLKSLGYRHLYGGEIDRPLAYVILPLFP